MSYEGAKASFNRAAEEYDAWRPNYPAATIQRIIQTSNLRRRSRILEVGAGTGKASLLFANHGYEMVCLEPGKEMGAILRRNLRPYPKAKVVKSTLERWRIEPQAFDLVISAQAFHWIDPDVGYPRAAKALKPGGWIAFFWNLPSNPKDGVHKAIQAAYREHAPKLAHRYRERSKINEAFEMRERLASFADLFPVRRIYKTCWRKTYDADHYLRLIGTYSDHIELSERARRDLYDAIRKVIDKSGGKLLRHYSTLLAMGQTPKR